MKKYSFVDKDLFAPKTPWDSLSIAEKSAIMEAAISEGVYEIKDIKQKYNEFAKGGNLPQTDWSYDSWKKQIAAYKGLDVDNDNTYDYESFFRENPQMAWKILNDAPDAHFTDTYKTAYHPTFSTLSRYSGQYHPQYNPQALKGGEWNREGTVFTMSPDGYRGPVSMDDRKWYLENAENNGVQLREADGSLPVYDGIPWGGVLPAVTITGRKKSLGGELRGPLVDSLLYGDGGNLLDGWDDAVSLLKRGWSKVKRIANTASMVQATPGTATGYAATGQYMPRVKSTVGDEAAYLLDVVTAPTQPSDIKAAYQAVRHPVRTARAVRQGVSEGIRRLRTAEWAEAINPAKITADNAVAISDAQWDAAYNAALESENIKEIQRLRDLHFLAKAPNTRIRAGKNTTQHIYHGTNNDWTVYDPSKFSSATDEGYYGVGLYGTEYRPLAKGYGDNVLDLYINSEKPFAAGARKADGNLFTNMNEAIDRTSASYYFNRGKHPDSFSKADVHTDLTQLFSELDNSDAVIYGTPSQRFNEVVVPDGRQMKFANPVTFDDVGNVIPLSKRDNFNINELRYAMPPILFGSALFSNLKSNSKP